jgi:hypothetical protein
VKIAGTAVAVAYVLVPVAAGGGGSIMGVSIPIGVHAIVASPPSNKEVPGSAVWDCAKFMGSAKTAAAHAETIIAFVQGRTFISIPGYQAGGGG